MGPDGRGEDHVRVVVGEDSVLLREGIVRVLGEAGFEVVAEAGDAEELVRKVSALSVPGGWLCARPRRRER